MFTHEKKNTKSWGKSCHHLNFKSFYKSRPLSISFGFCGLFQSLFSQYIYVFFSFFLTQKKIHINSLVRRIFFLNAKKNKTSYDVHFFLFSLQANYNMTKEFFFVWPPPPPPNKCEGSQNAHKMKIKFVHKWIVVRTSCAHENHFFSILAPVIFIVSRRLIVTFVVVSEWNRERERNKPKNLS